MLTNLKAILQYTNPDIIERYQQDYPHNKLTGPEALKQFIQYIWVSKKHQFDKEQNPKQNDFQFECGLYEEMQEIDDMWHTFLLFTEDYSSFCHYYFDQFIHHIPNTGGANASENSETEFTRYLSYVYEHLGPETLKIWFAKYF